MDKKIHEKDLKSLVDISRHYGINRRAVIAGGGNTSMKSGDRLWIKASGHALGSMDESGFAVLDRKKLRVISTREYSSDPFERERQIKDDLTAANLTPERRPSVETSLHDLVRYRFVVHLHPTLVNGIMCGQAVEEYILPVFGEKALYVPYTDPGYVLFKEIERRLEKYREKFPEDPAIILIQNHGIFVGADSTQEVRKIYDDLFKRLGKYAESMPSADGEQDLPVKKGGTGPGHSPADDRTGKTAGVTTPPGIDPAVLMPALRTMLSEGGLKTLRLRNNPLVEHFISSADNFRKISKPFTPDIIVYCKSSFLYLENPGTGEGLLDRLAKKVDEFSRGNGYLPKVILVRGLGLVAAGENAADADTILDVFEDKMHVAWLSESFGGPHHMTPEQIRFIDTWEVENYRRKTAAGEAAKGAVDQRTVIVTGAAMGFGAGIARGLFERGANVVIADINGEAGNRTLEEFSGMGRKNQAAFVRTDVSDPASLENLVQESVKAFGGIDAFISNAGILRAGGLDEMDEKTFDLVTRINYNAYFYGVKAVSRIMKIQQKAQERSILPSEPGSRRVSDGKAAGNWPRRFCDIIQINSKSGLSGSRKNFAYAGGKFGGIGLTQSFALELAPYSIKVNSICPGNFFEGPLWSDPENGLFVQYLNAGKVPGAKSVDEVRKHYESQVPLGRGCRVEDVLRAVLYVIEQEYETGQAVPVTGGQTMLN
jgi:NAD(P)-dependent dehydrogenase (short-subunit alcohol dehydrogenase family)/rhamnose utilization protein RhaD (predicted bifunctional aldolase and dehydrogenase)